MFVLRFMVRLSLLPCLAFTAIPAPAAVITVDAAKDTSIYQGWPNNSAGGAPGIFAGMDGTSAILRGLIEFDVAGSIPAGASITDVQLTLTLGQVAGGGAGGGDTTPRTIGLHRLSADWGEGTSGSNFSTIAGTGAGFPAGSGDATWNARHFDASSPVPWSIAGGDAAGSPSATAIVAQTMGPYSWISTPTLLADVQAWLDAPQTNFGWVLRNETETGSRTFRAFWTREASNATFRPRLQITYSQVPEPSMVSAMIALFAISSTLPRRARRGTHA